MMSENTKQKTCFLFLDVPVRWTKTENIVPLNAVLQNKHACFTKQVFHETTVSVYCVQLSVLHFAKQVASHNQSTHKEWFT